MTFKKLALNSVFLSSMAVLTACDNGNGGSDGLLGSSPEPSPSSEPVGSTTFTISVEAPDSLAGAQTASIFDKLGQFFLPSAYAIGNDDLDADNFVVTIVDTAGNVVELVEIAAENIFQNEDGTWAIQVPGDPRLDCVIAVDVNGSPQVTVGSPLPSDTLQAPTLDEDIDIDIASTVAFQSFIESLAEEGGGAGVGFDELDIDVDDSTELAAVEQLIIAVEETFDDLVDSGAIAPEDFTSVESFYAEVEAVTAEVIEQEIENIQSSVSDTLADNINGGGALYWWEAEDEGEDGFFIERGVVSTSAEVLYEYDVDGGQWQMFVADVADDDLVLSADGWVFSSDSVVISNVADDGTITVADGAVASIQETVISEQSIDLNGRSIADFAATNADIALLSPLIDAGANFGDGARAYRITAATITDVYHLWYEPGDDNGTCPWSEQSAAALGGNCITAIVNNSGQDEAAPATLDALLSESAADATVSAPQIKGVQLAWTEQGIILAELVDNSARDVNVYHYIWQSSAGTSEYEFIAAANWQQTSPAGLPDGESMIVLELPDAVLEAGDMDEDERIAIFAVHDSFVRQGSFEAAGAEESGITVYNELANNELLAALDFVHISALYVNEANACSFASEWDDTAYDGFGGPASEATMVTFEKVVELCRQNTGYEGAGFVAADLQDSSFLVGNDTYSFNADGSGDSGAPFTWSVAEGRLSLSYNDVQMQGDSGTSYTLNASEIFEVVAQDSSTGLMEFRAFFQNDLWQQASPGPAIDAAFGDLWSGGFEELSAQP
ncbi:hypothetical protein [Agaribacterium haliotis]|uniref:hypothetical protein n=1 Tax=Agaribacterium haliotis TaxID=2013869 RepID=UPI000BB58178|nr:hypothetical protein [Agaribacterium haliotis]